MMKTVRLDKLFSIKYGTDLELNKLEQSQNGVNFVSRNRNNNGVVAKVKPLENITANPAGSLSVALGSSSVLYAFYQAKEYYSGRDLAYLVPNVKMTTQQMLYYCACLIENRYKYNYGRQANRTLGDIIVPSLECIPVWVNELKIKDLSCFMMKHIDEDPLYYNTDTWHEFAYDEIFYIERGESYYFKYSKKGNYPYASATDVNNGISGYVSNYNRDENLISVNYDGSVASAFYHSYKFFASEKVVTVKPKHFELNQFNAMFLLAVIQQEKFRYNYGYKWSVEKRLRLSKIKLPAIQINEFDYTPDHVYMEEYIKRLPFTKNL